MPTPLHERTQIRAAAIALLTGETSAGANVYSSRMGPLPSWGIPALAVYTDDEEVDPASKNTSPRELKRKPKLVIEAWVSVPANGQLDDAFDVIAREIEVAMDADADLDETVFSSILNSTEMGWQQNGARPMGCVKLEYEVTYHTQLRLADPEDDFDSTDIRTSLEGAQAEADQSEDIVEDIHE